jgi:hypothetical protein
MLGSWLLAAIILGSAPLGFALGLVGALASRSIEQSPTPALVGLSLNIIAVVTWIITWAGVLGWLFYALRDFHF